MEDTEENIRIIEEEARQRKLTEKSTSYSFGRLRSRGPTVIIDAKVLIDVTVYKRFLKRNNDEPEDAIKELKEYYAFIFKGTDMIYWENTDGRIRLKVAKFEIWQEPSDSILPESIYKSGSIESYEDVLDYLEKYASSTKYDLTIFFTRLNVNRPVLGYTRPESLCDTSPARRFVVIIESFQQETIFTLVHEIGHSLSSPHDGDEEVSCSEYDFFIMYPGGESVPLNKISNRWKFSSCTLEIISEFVSDENFVESDRWDCLAGTMRESTMLPDVSEKLFGQIFTADDQCNMTYYTNGSSKCKNLTDADPCISLMCNYDVQQLDRRLCIRQQPVHGTACQAGKVCQMGQCVNIERVIKPPAPKEGKYEERKLDPLALGVAVILLNIILLIIPFCCCCCCGICIYKCICKPKPQTQPPLVYQPMQTPGIVIVPNYNVPQLIPINLEEPKKDDNSDHIAQTDQE